MTENSTQVVQKKNKVKVETIDIHGKPYVPVFENVKRFVAEYPNGRILFEKVLDDGQRIQFVAKLYKDFNIDDYVKCANANVDYLPDAIGFAEEVLGGAGVNKTSHVENCQTSSAGRALRFIYPSVEATDYELVTAASNLLNSNKSVPVVKQETTIDKLVEASVGAEKSYTKPNNSNLSQTQSYDTNVAIVQLKRLQKQLPAEELLDVLKKAWVECALPSQIIDFEDAKAKIIKLGFGDTKELAVELQKIS